MVFLFVFRLHSRTSGTIDLHLDGVQNHNHNAQIWDRDSEPEDTPCVALIGNALSGVDGVS